MGVKNIAIYLFHMWFVTFAVFNIPVIYTFWMILALPLRWINIQWFYEFQNWLDKITCGATSISSYIVGHELYEMGDDITPCVSGNARTLFLSNHINADDVFASYDFFNSRPVFPDNIMLGSFHPIKYCHLGLTLQWRRDIFLKQGVEFREYNQQEFKTKLTEVFIPRRRFIIMYPEGRYAYHLRDNDQKYAKKNNLKMFKHLVLPRIGAVKSILNILAPPNEEKHYLDYVVDISMVHEYEHHVYIANSGFRTKNRTFFLYRVYRANDIPQEEKALKQWMYDRWMEKDNFIDEFKRTGQFPAYGQNKPTLVQLDRKAIFRGTVFWMVSAVIHYSILLYLYFKFIHSEELVELTRKTLDKYLWFN